LIPGTFGIEFRVLCGGVVGGSIRALVETVG